MTYPVATRQKQLTQLKSYIEEIDKETTLMLQSLQWDRKHLLEGQSMVTCKYDNNHKIPPDKREEHENECFLKSQGYSKDMKMLPDSFDSDAKTLVIFGKEDIAQIINEASKMDLLFKKGSGCQDTELLTLERLQATYTADERRAIHDAVVKAVPSCHDLTDLVLPSSSDADQKKSKSRLEILAELRDMKRRRTKYRVAAKTRNYSDVLRDVIKTQMEMYTESETEQTITKRQQIDKRNDNKQDNSEIEEHLYKQRKHTRARDHSREREKADRSTNRKRHDSKDYHRDNRDRHTSRYNKEKYDRNSYDVKCEIKTEDSEQNIYKKIDERLKDRGKDRYYEKYKERDNKNYKERSKYSEYKNHDYGKEKHRGESSYRKDYKYHYDKRSNHSRNERTPDRSIKKEYKRYYDIAIKEEVDS